MILIGISASDSSTRITMAKNHIAPIQLGCALEWFHNVRIYLIELKLLTLKMILAQQNKIIFRDRQSTKFMRKVLHILVYRLPVKVFVDVSEVSGTNNKAKKT